MAITIGGLHYFIALDTKHIRQLARELVDCKYKERKAWIVIGTEGGYSQSEIAHKLGITRQAVSKFMATDSFRQLTAIYRRRV